MSPAWYTSAGVTTGWWSARGASAPGWQQTQKLFMVADARGAGWTTAASSAATAIAAQAAGFSSSNILAGGGGCRPGGLGGKRGGGAEAGSIRGAARGLGSGLRRQPAALLLAQSHKGAVAATEGSLGRRGSCWAGRGRPGPAQNTPKLCCLKVIAVPGLPRRKRHGRSQPQPRPLPSCGRHVANCSHAWSQAAAWLVCRLPSRPPLVPALILFVLCLLRWSPTDRSC